MDTKPHGDPLANAFRRIPETDVVQLMHELVTAVDAMAWPDPNNTGWICAAMDRLANARNKASDWLMAHEHEQPCPHHSKPVDQYTTEELQAELQERRDRTEEQHAELQKRRTRLYDRLFKCGLRKEQAP